MEFKLVIHSYASYVLCLCPFLEAFQKIFKPEIRNHYHLKMRVYTYILIPEASDFAFIHVKQWSESDVTIGYTYHSRCARLEEATFLSARALPRFAVSMVGLHTPYPRRRRRQASSDMNKDGIIKDKGTIKRARREPDKQYQQYQQHQQQHGFITNITRRENQSSPPR
jgi:hypothetical protein